MEEHKNKMLGWLYRSIDLSGLTSAVWRLPIRPSESFDYVLHEIHAEYNSDGEEISNFDSISWAFQVPPQERGLMDLTDGKPRPLISLSLNMGVNDLTAGTTKPKEFFFPSPRIDWPIKALENFVFELENYTALTGSVSVLFIGSFILPKNVLVSK